MKYPNIKISKVVIDIEPFKSQIYIAINLNPDQINDALELRLQKVYGILILFDTTPLDKLKEMYDYKTVNAYGRITTCFYIGNYKKEDHENVIEQIVKQACNGCPYEIHALKDLPK